MPCCCATNVKAAFVLGIVLAVLSALVSCFNIEVSLGKLYLYFDKGQGEMADGMIANGIIGALITDRNFVDKCSQQVMHFDHEATH